ncbi:MAG: cytochrome C [Runella slithyformis]|nr:MAG: cytochrome C [Runella slithyformis]TAG20881.1 MAG: cytochrome C [Cytophagales bacterium]TAG39976.1 MAG: cytochrome C [Cytophagia bacterium]TAE99510.1 MAG: cytochrome C [Runella slithyformis]TAF27433.1 MAG: cytochrome C [Runella slithyformis]
MKSLNFLKSSFIIRFTLCVGLLYAGQLAAQDGDAANGETLFKNNCASCHNPGDQVVVGPGLKGIQQRRDLAWLVKWVKNPNGVIASGDQYAVDLYNKYGKAQMTAFPSYGEKEVKDILAYVEKYNTAPAVVAVPGGGAAQPAGTTSGPSDLFTYLLVALLIVMLLVLGVLMTIVSVLSKAVTGTEGTQATGETFMERLRGGLTTFAQNKAVRTASVWFFILMATKATLDGMYGIGIQQGYAPKQPISFSHKLHAGQYKIDCNYCHTGVNRGKSAHIPSANICMNCHGVIKKESPEIQKIYAAVEANKPVEWVRVHNLPDLAYFNHAQHVNVGGVQCVQCHGEIEKMEVVQQRSSLTMGWCIDCHRKTEVNTKGNDYYTKLVSLHKTTTKESLKVADIGGLECSKCHY